MVLATDKLAGGTSKVSISKKDILTLPVITIILANTILAVGVLFFNWDAFVIVSLYWIETIIIGFFTLIRFIFAPVQQINLKKKLIGIPIFSVFLGWFLSGYGVVIFFLFVVFPNRYTESEWLTMVPGGDYYQPSWPGPLGCFELGIDTIRLLYHILPSIVVIPILFFLISHIVSFVRDYLVENKRQFANLEKLGGETVSRILVFHFSIMIGGFLIAFFMSNMVVLVILVLLKCFFEVRMYLAGKSKAKKIPDFEVMAD